jgi:hypothetical protein
VSFPTTNARADGKLRKWKKILGRLQNAAGALSVNNPKPADGLRRTKVKVLRAFRAISTPGG